MEEKAKRYFLQMFLVIAIWLAGIAFVSNQLASGIVFYLAGSLSFFNFIKAVDGDK